MEDPLFIKQFVTSVRRQPLNTHYQSYTSDSDSLQGITWNIDSPFAGALLDNEVWIEYDVVFSSTNDSDETPATQDFTWTKLFEGFVAAGEGDFRGLPVNSQTLAFGQGFAIGNAISNCEVVINGQSLRQNPQRWMGEFARFYAHPTELAGVATMSGGELDCGNHSLLTKDTPAAWAKLSIDDVTKYNSYKRQVNNSGALQYPGDTSGTPEFLRMTRGRGVATDDRWLNTGFACRRHRLIERWRENKAANAAPTDGTMTLATTGAQQFERFLTLKVYERLPISPFLLWEAKDKRRSIPYVDKMEISLSFISDAYKHIFQGSVSDAFLKDQVNWHTGAKIHLKWYIPPPGMALPPELSIPVSVYKESVMSVDTIDANAAQVKGGPTVTDQVSYENLRLQQVPDLLFIYVKIAPGSMTLKSGAERHQEITNAEITLNGDSGKIVRANASQLFSMYLKNSPMRAHRAMEYSEWQKYFCTLALKPSDLGVRVPPGVNHGVTLDVRLTIANWWQIPRLSNGLGAGDSADFTSNTGTGEVASAKYEIHILGIYDKYELTLTNRGNAQLKLQNMPSLDLPQSLAVVDRQDLRAQFA